MIRANKDAARLFPPSPQQQKRKPQVAAGLVLAAAAIVCLATGSTVRKGYSFQRSTSLKLMSYHSMYHDDTVDIHNNDVDTPETTTQSFLSSSGWQDTSATATTTSMDHQRDQQPQAKIRQDPQPSQAIIRQDPQPQQKNYKFYMIPTPEVTDWLLQNHTEAAQHYYEHALNEDQAELWLYRALQQHPQRTLDANEADAFVLCGCLHLNYHLQKQVHGNDRRRRRRRPPQKTFRNDTNQTQQQQQQQQPAFHAKEYAALVASRLVDTSKPHLLAIPTTNPGTSRYIGVRAMVKALQAVVGGGDDDGSNTNINSSSNNNNKLVWSLGFERNTYWQGLPPDRILPVPYVVRSPPASHHNEAYSASSSSQKTISTNDTRTRIPDFIFYAGDRRVHAQEWSGCDRSMVEPLAREPNMDVRLIDSSPGGGKQKQQQQQQRLTQDEYNYRMESSDYCLILCGDSPTSRSLTSAMVHGCIPLRIGSRLRGLCEPPCRKGWGWTISGEGHSHLPYSSTTTTTAAVTATKRTFSPQQQQQQQQQLDWTLFPEVNEAQFINDPASVLRDKISTITSEEQNHLRTLMQENREAFIYGWGNPVTSKHFGKAASYILDSFWQSLMLEQSQ